MVQVAEKIKAQGPCDNNNMMIIITVQNIGRFVLPSSQYHILPVTQKWNPLMDSGGPKCNSLNLFYDCLANFYYRSRGACNVSVCTCDGYSGNESFKNITFQTN